MTSPPCSGKSRGEARENGATTQRARTVTKRAAMTGIGSRSPWWRRAAFRWLGSTYVRRRGATDDGLFEAYVSAGSSLKVLDPRGLPIDPVHRRFIRDRIAPDAVIWDIGANLGLFAFPAALKARSGRVYAFEPDVDLAANLARGLRLPRNRGLPVTPLCLAVSDADGIATFEVSKFSRAMNRLAGVGAWNDASIVTQERRSVPTLSIDTLAKSLGPPGVIKIDVEGAELRVLEGGRMTLAAHRPILLIEAPNELSGGLKSFFAAHDYVMLDGAAEPPVALEEPAWDTIAVPRELCRAPQG
jgi:FkbM family methyltransferase